MTEAVAHRIHLSKNFGHFLWAMTRPVLLATGCPGKFRSSTSGSVWIRRPRSHQIASRAGDVGFWHLADMLSGSLDVRFQGQSGQGRRCAKSPLLTQIAEVVKSNLMSLGS